MAVLAAVLLPGLLSAQRYSFKVYGEEHDLNNLAILCLLQDRAGFLWVGTQNGLYRYDGAKFRSFGMADGLPSARVLALHETPDGVLWAGTRSGLARWTGRRFEAADLGGPAELQGPGSLASDAWGNLYAGTSRGLAIGQPAGDGAPYRFRFYAPEAGLAGSAVYAVHVDPAGTVWFGCGRGLCRLGPDGLRKFGRDAGLPEQRWDAIATDPAGNLWLRSSTRLMVRPAAGGRFVRRDENLPQISDFGYLYRDRDGSLLVPTDLGLARQADGKWNLIAARQGLPANPVSCALRDREGSLWIGTLGSGLARWLGFGQWETWTSDEGLSSDVVWAVRRDPNGALWVGTDRGLNSLSPDGRVRTWTRRDGLSGDRVRAIALGPDGAVWAGAAPGGLSRLDPRTRKIHAFGPESGLLHDRVYGLLFDSDRRLWVTTRGGLYRSRSAGPQTAFDRQPVPGTDDNELFLEVLQDRRGRVWIAGSHGLVRWDSGAWRRFTVADGLRSNYVGYLAEAQDGTLWIAYHEALGLSQIAAAEDGIRVWHVEPPPNLLPAQPLSLEFDRQGRLWYGTDRGVNVMENGAWRRYDRTDGLVWNDCNGSALFADVDGSLWIGASRGLSHFRPAGNAARQDPLPSVLLTDVRFGGKEHPLRPPIQIPHRESELAAAFAVLSFREEDSLVFRYRLSGLEDTWNETTSRSIRYPRLGPGAYTLELEARNADGARTGKPTRLSFEILPPWWGTWAFRICLISAAFLGVASRWTCRIRRLLQEQRRLEEMVQVRTRELNEEKEKYRSMAEALRESDEQFRMVIQATNDAVWDWNLTTNTVTWNENLQTLFGYTPEQVAPDATWWYGNVHPDDRQRVAAGLSSALQKGGPLWADEYRFRRADGSYACVLDRGYVLLDAAGTPVRMIGALMDITDRKKTEDELRRSEEQFRLHFEQSPVAMHEVDVQGVIQRVNQAECKLLGYLPSELLGKSVFDFVAPQERSMATTFFRGKIIGQYPLAPFQREYLRRDGSVITVEIHETLIHDSSDNIVGIRSALVDVTERNRAEQALRLAMEAAEAANRAKGEFLANMSHEIRTPMNGILGMTALALATDLNAEQREYIQIVKNSAESLLTVINDILDFSKMEAGKLQLERTGFNLRGHLADILATVSLPARAKNIEVAWSAAPDVPDDLVGDPLRLRQILVNLLGNAVKFTERGEIALRVDLEMQTASAARLHFQVTDTGIGISPEHQNRIFAAFEQADMSTTRQFGGTGLGLAICSRLVSAMGPHLGRKPCGEGKHVSFHGGVRH